VNTDSKVKKITVIFTGIGYNADRPLLYYSKKIALEQGHEIIIIDFGDIDKECLRDRQMREDAFDKAFKKAETVLADTDFASYDEIFFISKSIGTVVASVYASRHGVPARQVYFTPLLQTFSLAEEGNGLVFFGDRDPWIETDAIRDLCISKKLRFRIIEGSNHSLETGRVYNDVINITGIIHEAEDYIVGGQVSAREPL